MTDKTDQPAAASAIDRWFQEHIAGSAIAGEEKLLELVRAAVDELKRSADDLLGDVEGAGQRIETWFVAHFHASAISVRTDIFNVARRAVDDLKLLIKEI